MAQRRPLVVIGDTPQLLPDGDTVAGASGGTQQVFVQDTRPAGLGPWNWWRTESGVIVDLIIADGL